jgi:hypothetical protein
MWGYMRRILKITVLLFTAALVGGVGYGAGRAIKGDSTYLKQSFVYHYKNAVADIKATAHTISEWVEPGTRVTRVSYGVFRDTVSIPLEVRDDDIIAQGRVAPDVAEKIQTGTEVVLYDGKNVPFREPAILSAIEKGKDEAVLSFVLPNSIGTTGKTKWRAEMTWAEADNIKRLPVSALVTSEDGEHAVWIAQPQGEHYIATLKPVSVGLKSNTIFEADHTLSTEDLILLKPGKNLKEGQKISRVAKRTFPADTQNTHEILAQAAFNEDVQKVRVALFQIKANADKAQGTSCDLPIDPLAYLTDNPPPPPQVVGDPNAYPKPKGCGTCGVTPASAPAGTKSGGGCGTCGNSATPEKPVLQKPPMPF